MQLGTLSSPPSRAAWIEMLADGKKLTKIESPPSRAAWIEMRAAVCWMMILTVAAFTGGVD